jgi:hypothetical protein
MATGGMNAKIGEDPKHDKVGELQEHTAEPEMSVCR